MKRFVLTLRTETGVGGLGPGVQGDETEATFPDNTTVEHGDDLLRTMLEELIRRRLP
jgi:hypothetical protein